MATYISSRDDNYRIIAKALTSRQVSVQAAAVNLLQYLWRLDEPVIRRMFVDDVKVVDSLMDNFAKSDNTMLRKQLLEVILALLEKDDKAAQDTAKAFHEKAIARALTDMSLFADEFRGDPHMQPVPGYTELLLEVVTRMVYHGHGVDSLKTSRALRELTQVIGPARIETAIKLARKNAQDDTLGVKDYRLVLRFAQLYFDMLTQFASVNDKMQALVNVGFLLKHLRLEDLRSYL